MTKPNTGARYEIAIDGTTRTYRDIEKLAFAAATRLKTKQPHSQVTVRGYRERQGHHGEAPAGEIGHSCELLEKSEMGLPFNALREPNAVQY